MPDPPRDPVVIDERDLRRLSNADLLRLFARARDGREPDRVGKGAWEAIVVRHYDRVRGFVESFRFPGQAGVRIAPHDYDDATQEAFLRVLNGLKLRGETYPEFLKAVRSTTFNSCMDFCRRTLARERHERGSFDETVAGAEGEERGRFDHELGDLGQRRHDDDVSGREDLRELIDALPAVANENMRAVLVMTIDRVDENEIARRLETSRANVYQLRSRGIRRLREVIRERGGAA
jgi:RNA polymerase sigma factor (sigma-70 family)